MDEMIDALINVIELKRKRDKAFEDCDSSWGHYGYDIERQLEEAKERSAKALKRFICENTPHYISGGAPK